MCRRSYGDMRDNGRKRTDGGNGGTAETEEMEETVRLKEPIGCTSGGSRTFPVTPTSIPLKSDATDSRPHTSVTYGRGRLRQW